MTVSRSGGGQLRFRLFYDSGKGLGIMDRHFGEHFPVDGDFSEPQTVHELAVGDILGQTCGGEADDPE